MNLSDWSLSSVANFGNSPAWSPDGTRLAVAAGPLYVMNADGSGVSQVPNVVGSVGLPTWSPDGLTIAFDCELESGNFDICSINIDGTGFMRLTSDPAWDTGAAYSPDGFTVAFATSRYGGGSTIAVMNPDGTGVGQVSASISAVRPAWSPDGTRIAFFTSYSPEGVACNADGSICWEALERNDVMVMNPDGSELRPMASGRNPAWALAVRPVASFISQGCEGLTCSFDGSGSWGGTGTIRYSWHFGDGTTDSGPTATHSYAASGTYTVTLTAEDGAGVTGTQSRSLVVSSNNLPPTAAFTYACSGRQCTFDGSASSDPTGPIVMYRWSFGDGEPADSATGSIVTHTYAGAGAFAVTLIVTDDAGGTGTQQHVLSIVNAAPMASFTPACIELTCTFNGSSSSDLDGMIASHLWLFGDGTSGSGATVSHTYAAGGTYAVTLTVTDNDAVTSSQTQSVTVVPPEIHAGDLDGASTSMQNRWTATVSVVIHDRSHGGVPNATVIGSWNDGSTASCTTNASGQCAVSMSGIPKNTHSASFSVANVTRSPFLYTRPANHDPDGDSNGTTVSVSRP
jgi:TolB protein